MQEISDRGLASISERSPHQIATILGASQGHIQKSDTFRQGLPAGASSILFLALRADVFDDPARIVFVMENHVLVSLSRNVPAEWTEHHGVFQSFAFVDRDNLDCFL